MANKCWPAFQTQFGFVPCYVNSRLTKIGIPVACEVDIYGAVSEYIGVCVSQKPVTLLDINNTVPADIYNDDIAGKFPYTHKDTFMGFHCGNTASCLVKEPEMKFQRIMKRNLEPDSEPNISRGTLEGDIVDGNITFFRFQSTADAQLKGYIAEGEVLPVATRHSVLSEFSLSTKWADFTAMFSFRRTILTTVLLLLVTMERHSTVL